MKKQILFTLSFLCSLSAFSCGGFFYSGKVIVVNEQMQVLENVGFWEMRNTEDSAKRSKNRWIRDAKSDSLSFRFYTGYGHYNRRINQEEKTPSKYKYRIKAEGYADVIIAQIEFNSRDWSDSNSIEPVLYIVMKTHQFFTIGNKVERIEAYQIKKSIAVKDTIIFIPKIASSHSIGNSEVSSQISTYPNPFTEEIHLSLPAKPQTPFNYKIYTLLGKELLEGTISKQKNIIKMNALKPGKYIFQLTDEQGNISYLHKVIKISSS